MQALSKLVAVDHCQISAGFGQSFDQN